MFFLRESVKAYNLRFNTLKDYYWNEFYKCIWLPKSQIRSFEKRYLTNGEMVHILDIPDWLINEHKLWEFYFRDPLDFVNKVDKIVAVRTSRTTTIEMHNTTDGIVKRTKPIDFGNKLKRTVITILKR